ncbi:MAG: acetoacetate--CoA ligase [Moraxellaceae bacterium]|jgi:acetoacetyl-CoA synthetase|nr:acetoacetate--CoA ligase [Moraxellaceae bacterium]
MSDILWQPTAERIASTQLAAWQQWLASDQGLVFDSYADLHQWSVTHREEFWKSIWNYFGINSHSPYRAVLENDVMPGASWFPGATLNFAEHLLRYRDNRTALISHLENGERRTLTYAELFAHVSHVAAFFRGHGISTGDRVVGFMPNVQETVVAMLAATSLGATWSSCSPDFGLQGVLDRFGQIAPSLLIAADGYYYNGKRVDCGDKISAIASQLPSLKKVLVVPLTGNTTDLSSIANAECWTTALATPADTLSFTPVPFQHPLYIMYSSGTTGVPKCIVHGTGGTLLQHLKELALHTDVSRDDVVFYYTTCGWMMWNWLISTLALGATVVLYDGSPFAHKPDILLDIAEKENITIFGTSAKYIAALEKSGCKPRETHHLDALKAVLSTGSPLAHESFDYVYRDIKPDLCLSSISGGTDIVSCFALGNPTLPVYRGELQCKGLGMAVDIFNESGHSVTNEKGELVCTQAFPCMPIGFWNDEDGEKYRQAYFDRFPGLWAHGDYGEQNTHGGLIIHGRSDAVLNPGGVRIGTAEIYRQVEKVTEVMESIAIGQDWDNDVRVVLFVKLREGINLTEILQRQIRDVIRANTTPRHVPARIVQVSDIPRTISGKIVELAVRNVVHGQPVKNTDALANPEALDCFRNRNELTI